MVVPLEAFAALHHELAVILMCVSLRRRMQDRTKRSTYWLIAEAVAQVKVVCIGVAIVALLASAQEACGTQVLVGATVAAEVSLLSK